LDVVYFDLERFFSPSFQQITLSVSREADPTSQEYKNGYTFIFLRTRDIYEMGKNGGEERRVFLVVDIGPTVTIN